MIASDLSALSNDELNAEAARLQGYRETEVLNLFVNDNGEYLDLGNPHPMDGERYDPSNNLNHAARLSAAFLAAHPNMRMSGHLGWDNLWYWMAYDPRMVTGAVVVDCTHASEARARTEAVCAAWAALEGGRG